MAFELLIAAAGGLLLGCLLNVVARRLPRRESLLAAGPPCSSCGQPLGGRDNVPLLSWLWLRGCCPSCDEPIASRYPLVQATTGVLFATIVAVHHHDLAQLVLGLVLVAFLIPLTLIDMELRILPDRLTAPAAVLGLVLGTGLDPDGEPERLAAAAIAGTFFFVAWYLRPGGMGFGDVKLVVVLGLFVGRSVAVALLAALILGGLAGIVIMRRTGVAAGRGTALAFGPFLALGGVLAILTGGPLVDLYLDTL